MRFDPECCHILAFDGWGGNCFCYGSVCCASQAVKDWSREVSSGGMQQGPTVVVVNSPY